MYIFFQHACKAFSLITTWQTIYLIIWTSFLTSMCFCLKQGIVEFNCPYIHFVINLMMKVNFWRMYYCYIKMLKPQVQKRQIACVVWDMLKLFDNVKLERQWQLGSSFLLNHTSFLLQFLLHRSSISATYSLCLLYMFFHIRLLVPKVN